MFFLQLRNELWKLFGKKRTYIGFGTFLLAQNAMLLAFHFTKWEEKVVRLLEGNGYLAMDFISALSVALIMLFPQILFLMPLYACLVGGDLVAKEAEDGTLRMILSRPISRVRLMFIKWCAGVVFSIVLVVALGLMAVVFARMWFPWQGMFVFIPEPERIFNVMSAAQGLKIYSLSHVFLAINAATMMTIAFMFGCFNMKPAAATVLGFSFLLLNLVMENIPFFQDYREFMLLHHFRTWVAVYAQPIPWSRIVESLFILFGFNLTFFIIGCTGFQMRDIKS
ncbi:MAG: ABC transporter permease subunit [Verrucomicrobia bacterium]|jgi:ABC-2 type transport system permease protein|nr:ABC transporter permease subunit [Verrucomicrobiota bacterium]